MHSLIGPAIEEVYAGRLEERAEELVYHFIRGEVWDKVVHYAREAAERAAALCVDDRAVDSGDAVALKREAQAVKPADPAPIEVALEADLATSGLVTIAR